jgi:small redox-active disulfide protein 2
LVDSLEEKMAKIKIEVLGTGCPKCKKLAEVADQAARSLGIDYDLEKVTDLQKIMAYGVLMTPALVVNGRVLVSGKVPSLDETKKMLA